MHKEKPISATEKGLIMENENERYSVFIVGFEGRENLASQLSSAFPAVRQWEYEIGTDGARYIVARVDPPSSRAFPPAVRKSIERGVSELAKSITGSDTPCSLRGFRTGNKEHRDELMGDRRKELSAFEAAFSAEFESAAGAWAKSCPGTWKDDSEKPTPLDELANIAQRWRNACRRGHGDRTHALRLGHVADGLAIVSALQVSGMIFDIGFWEHALRSLSLADQTTGLAEAMHVGARGGEWASWRKLPNALMRYQNAALRHYLHAVYYPLDRVETFDGYAFVMDSETGLRHDAHAAASIAIVIDLLSEREIAVRREGVSA